MLSPYYMANWAAPIRKQRVCGGPDQCRYCVDDGRDAVAAATTLLSRSGRGAARPTTPTTSLLIDASPPLPKPHTDFTKLTSIYPRIYQTTCTRHDVQYALGSSPAGTHVVVIHAYQNNSEQGARGGATPHTLMNGPQAAAS